MKNDKKQVVLKTSDSAFYVLFLTFRFVEWRLRLFERESMDEHGRRTLFRCDGGEVVALRVPTHRFHRLADVEDEAKVAAVAFARPVHALSHKVSKEASNKHGESTHVRNK